MTLADSYLSLSPGSTTTHTLYLQGSPNNFNQGPLPGVPYGGQVSFAIYASALQPNSVALTFSIPTTTIPLGDTSLIAVSYTITVPSSGFSPSGSYSIAATDGISTSTGSLVVDVT
jgi:hypothetical protein